MEEFIEKKTFIKVIVSLICFILIIAVITDFPLYSKIKHETDNRYDVAMIGTGENMQRVFSEFSNVFDSFAQKRQAMVVYHVYKSPYSDEEIDKAISLMTSDNVDLIISGQSIVQKITHQFPNVPIIVPFSSDVTEKKLLDTVTSKGSKVVFLDSQHNLHSVKRFETLLQTIPNAKKILILRGDPKIFGENNKVINELQEVSGKQGIEIIDKVFKTRSELQLFLSTYDFEKVDAIYRYPGSFIGSNIDLIFDANKKYRKPIVVINDVELTNGGLVSYGPTVFELGARTAGIANQILFEGQKAEDMSVIYPNSVKLGVNIRFAKSLNIKIPEKILKEADYIIE